MAENHIKYRQIKAFTMVVEHGSFKAAADRLAVTQPSFSALIKELERDVDVVLFDRTTRRCVLTDAGMAFYNQVKTALDQLEDAYRYVKDLGSGHRGRLGLAALPSLASGVITTALARFRREFPGVRIALHERRNDQILDAVRHGDAEIGVGAMWRSDPDLDFAPLFTDRLMIVAPENHPLEKMRPVWKSLEKFDLILMRSGPADHALKVANVRRSPVFEVEHAVTALAMVRQGMGITVLPSSIIPNLNIDGLACIHIQGSLAVRRLGIVNRKGQRLSAPARAFAVMLEAVT